MIFVNLEEKCLKKGTLLTDSLVDNRGFLAANVPKEELCNYEQGCSVP